MNAIEIVGLTKTFGSRTAVDALNLSVLRGETFALLGQNGYALLQDLGVGGGRGGYVQSDGLLRFRRLLGLRVIGGVGLGRVIGLAAAGGEGQGQRQGQQSGKNLVFHVLFLQ